MRIQDIPTFCINLKEATKRWDNIELQAKYYGINIQRWEASRPEEVKGTFPGYLPSGARACTYSHLQIYRDCLEKGIDVIFILEDDAKFRYDWLDIMNEKLKTINTDDPNWDAIFLNVSESIEQREKWVEVREQYLTGGYIIHKRGMEWILNNYTRENQITYCIDWITTRMQYRGHSYSFFPWLIIQDASPSFIQQDNSPDYNKVLRLLKEANYSLENYSIRDKNACTGKCDSCGKKCNS